MHGSRVDAALAPLVPLRAELDALSGGFRVFSVEVPEGAACLRLDLFDVDGDLDLFAAHRVRVLSTGARTACPPVAARPLVSDKKRAYCSCVTSNLSM